MYTIWNFTEAQLDISIFGGIGAIAGIASTNAKKELLISVQYINGVESQAKIDSKMFELIQKHLFNIQNNPNYYANNKKEESMEKNILYFTGISNFIDCLDYYISFDCKKLTLKHQKT